jgi:hypothetical protein
MSNLFNFYVEADVDLKKSQDEGEWYISGYASTPDEDRQGESLIQKGLDISDFLDHGYFNFDHDNSHILGYPTENTHVDDKGLWVEGKLLKGVPIAERMWSLALALKKSNAPRKLGFSVEGKVLERDGQRITKAKIYNVAITPNPVNTNATWEAVVKSFKADSSSGLLLNKGLEAGYATSPESQSDGGAMRKESLESDIKRLAEKLDDYNYWSQVKRSMANGQTVSKAEMVIYLQLSKGMSRSQALDIIKN